MAKKIDAYIKLQVPAGQANPSPPVGPALGQHGLNIMEFCKRLMQTLKAWSRSAYSSRHHRIQRQKLYLHQEDAPGVDFVEESGRYSKWESRAACQKGRQGESRSA